MAEIYTERYSGQERTKEELEANFKSFLPLVPQEKDWYLIYIEEDGKLKTEPCVKRYYESTLKAQGWKILFDSKDFN